MSLNDQPDVTVEKRVGGVSGSVRTLGPKRLLFCFWILGGLISHLVKIV